MFERVCANQARLVAKWMSIGFVHGVMNTDNMTISGETIDYGPCAFIDEYHPESVYSSIDEQGRYAYCNQPGISQWNLARFAESILTLIDESEDKAISLISPFLDDYKRQYHECWLDQMKAKLGLVSNFDADEDLINDFLGILAKHKVDFTQGFRSLSQTQEGNPEGLFKLFADISDVKSWISKWQQRLSLENTDAANRKITMDSINPVYIPRNHLVEEVIKAAVDDGDLKPFEELLAVITNPFEAKEAATRFAEPAPESFGPYRTFCGT